MNQGHFEAQKHAFRQTSKGIVISYLIHPNDARADLVAAPIGTRYQIGYAEMNDEEIPDGQLPVIGLGEGGDGRFENDFLGSTIPTDPHEPETDWVV